MSAVREESLPIPTTSLLNRAPVQNSPSPSRADFGEKKEEEEEDEEVEPCEENPNAQTQALVSPSHHHFIHPSRQQRLGAIATDKRSDCLGKGDGYLSFYMIW